MAEKLEDLQDVIIWAARRDGQWDQQAELNRDRKEWEKEMETEVTELKMSLGRIETMGETHITNISEVLKEVRRRPTVVATSNGNGAGKGRTAAIVALSGGGGIGVLELGKYLIDALGR